MNKMFIPQEIKERLDRISVYDVAAKLNIEIKGNIAQCFMHDDQHPSLRFKKRNNSWKCYVCDKGGHSIELVKQYKKYKFQEACIWLARAFNISIPKTETVRLRKAPQRQFTVHKVNEVKVVDEELLNWIISVAKISPLAKKFLFEERKYTEEAVSMVHVGSISDAIKFKKVLIERFTEERCIKAGVLVKGKFGVYPVFRTPCLLFPFYDVDGRIRNIQSRYLGDNKEKKIPRFNNCIGLEPIMFNLPVLKQTGMDVKVYVAEGVTDCLAYLSEGKNAVALPGAGSFKEEFAKLLVDKMLFIYVDDDKPGMALFDKMNESLKKLGGCIHNIRKDNQFHDYSDFYKSKCHGKKYSE